MKKLISFVAFSIAAFASVVLAFSLTYQIKTTVVNVNDTACKLPSVPLVGREYVRIQNIGNVTVYLGSSTVGANTTATGGIQIMPYMVWEEKYDNTVNVYGRVVTGTCNIVVEEGK